MNQSNSNWIEELWPNTSQHFIAAGIHYGYPKCCIDEFIKYPPNQRSMAQNAIHMHTGFIPCANHAAAIFRDEITLESLITNRKCATPFPIGEYGEYD